MDAGERSSAVDRAHIMLGLDAAEPPSLLPADPVAYGTVTTAGSYAWGGAAATVFWLDPEEELAVVFMTQVGLAIHGLHHPWFASPVDSVHSFVWQTLFWRMLLVQCLAADF